MFHMSFMFLFWFVIVPVTLVMLIVYVMTRVFRRSECEDELAARKEEARINQEFADSMDRLERRIESLETILQDQMDATGAEEAPPPPPDNEEQR
ncbi:MAG: hypothetical protein ACOCWR_00900 [Oceanidesulfovibrio sp.]